MANSHILVLLAEASVHRLGGEARMDGGHIGCIAAPWVVPDSHVGNRHYGEQIADVAASHIGFGRIVVGGCR